MTATRCRLSPHHPPPPHPFVPAARALGASCPKLQTLEVFFDRYSLPSELFTDEGLIALSEGCRRLRRLALVNCDYVSDRALYAVAANCKGLEELVLGGYRCAHLCLCVVRLSVVGGGEGC